jgi:Arf-GAP/GTPase/ANK repeat/PH domain-containing protein 1/3
LSEGISDGCGVDTAGTGGLVTSTSSSVLIGGGEKEKPGSSGGKKEKQKEKKKRAKRTGSGVKNEEDEESCEFEIVSCDQKRWEFSAPSAEERDQWVTSIEHEIEKCLQQQLSLKDQQQLNGLLGKWRFFRGNK